MTLNHKYKFVTCSTPQVGGSGLRLQIVNDDGDDVAMAMMVSCQ